MEDWGKKKKKVAKKSWNIFPLPLVSFSRRLYSSLGGEGEVFPLLCIFRSFPFFAEVFFLRSEFPRAPAVRLELTPQKGVKFQHLSFFFFFCPYCTIGFNTTQYYKNTMDFTTNKQSQKGRLYLN